MSKLFFISMVLVSFLLGLSDLIDHSKSFIHTNTELKEPVYKDKEISFYNEDISEKVIIVKTKAVAAKTVPVYKIKPVITEVAKVQRKVHIPRLNGVGRVHRCKVSNSQAEGFSLAAMNEQSTICIYH